MKIFITGATGFIGKAVVNKLIRKKYKLVLLIRDKTTASNYSGNKNIKVVIGDLTKPKTYFEELHKCDVLIHLAAIRANWGNVEHFNRINVEIINNFFKENSRLKHIIITSSVFVHGNLSKIPTDENAPLSAYDIYGKSKIYLERLTQELSNKYGIKYTIIRPAVVYGPGDDESGMVIKLIQLVSANKLPLIGGGKNYWHLVYVDDLASAYVKVVGKEGNNKTYIIAGSKPIKLKKLIEIIKAKTKNIFNPRALPYYPFFIIGYMLEVLYSFGLMTKIKLFQKEPPLMRIKVDNLARDRYFDIAKAKKELNYNPKINYEQGIDRVVKWYAKNKLH